MCQALGERDAAPAPEKLTGQALTDTWTGSYRPEQLVPWGRESRGKGGAWEGHPSL